MRRFLDECQCHLAVSLHNPVAAERERLMPVERAYPLGDVLALLRQYDWSGQRRLSFEYTMFRGLNDDLPHAQRLVEALRGLECHVNLIRFHENGATIADGSSTKLSTSSPSAIAAFESYVNRNGGGHIVCTLRTSRGQDIDAACGLLAGKCNS
jgi:23S rRNA (adenine2503-C2)-methyltransferase